MKLFTENLLLAISIFLIGIILSIIISKISKIIFKRISKRTKTNFDDFVFETLSGIIRPIGFLLSAYFAIDYFFTDEITFISVLLNIQKLLILIIIIKALNKVLIRSLTESTAKIDDSSISSMISSLTPLIKAFTWTIGSIFFLQNIAINSVSEILTNGLRLKTFGYCQTMKKFNFPQPSTFVKFESTFVDFRSSFCHHPGNAIYRYF